MLVVQSGHYATEPKVFTYVHFARQIGHSVSSLGSNQTSEWDSNPRPFDHTGSNPGRCMVRYPTDARLCSGLVVSATAMFMLFSTNYVRLVLI